VRADQTEQISISGAVDVHHNRRIHVAEERLAIVAMDQRRLALSLDWTADFLLGARVALWL
jgi:hypothetical protein